jgi:hypothetical protein
VTALPRHIAEAKAHHLAQAKTRFDTAMVRAQLAIAGSTLLWMAGKAIYAIASGRPPA